MGIVHVVFDKSCHTVLLAPRNRPQTISPEYTAYSVDSLHKQHVLYTMLICCSNILNKYISFTFLKLRLKAIASHKFLLNPWTNLSTRAHAQARVVLESVIYN